MKKFGFLFSFSSNLKLFAGKSSRAGQKWRQKNETVFNNLHQYGLASNYIDVLVADASQSQIWRPQMLFDAIVADREYKKKYFN